MNVRQSQRLGSGARGILETPKERSFALGTLLNCDNWNPWNLRSTWDQILSTWNSSFHPEIFCLQVNSISYHQKLQPSMKLWILYLINSKVTCHWKTVQIPNFKRLELSSNISLVHLRACGAVMCHAWYFCHFQIYQFMDFSHFSYIFDFLHPLCTQRSKRSSILSSFSSFS